MRHPATAEPLTCGGARPGDDRSSAMDEAGPGAPAGRRRRSGGQGRCAACAVGAPWSRLEEWSVGTERRATPAAALNVRGGLPGPAPAAEAAGSAAGGQDAGRLAVAPAMIDHGGRRRALRADRHGRGRLGGVERDESDHEGEDGDHRQRGEGRREPPEAQLAGSGLRRSGHWLVTSRSLGPGAPAPRGRRSGRSGLAHRPGRWRAWWVLRLPRPYWLRGRGATYGESMVFGKYCAPNGGYPTAPVPLTVSNGAYGVVPS